ncbi:hypothetical protein MNBD_ALPHA12-1754 [hydrothermal vent metagenome]|uniref:Response regulatory domain-containing protein n=1 Tax=hydrothermal vent metagenome TaxID=652676 RepID=A0A3B0TNG3_9ZZZZ
MKPDILIVEDEPAILNSLEFILAHAGWETQSVTNGEAALEAIGKLLPRMVVLDVMLPRQSGFDVLKTLRGDAKTRNLPVLILTAKGQQQDRQTARHLGATSFVTKPYANTDVIEAVRQLIGTRRTQPSSSKNQSANNSEQDGAAK